MEKKLTKAGVYSFRHAPSVHEITHTYLEESIILVINAFHCNKLSITREERSDNKYIYIEVISPIQIQVGCSAYISLEHALDER